MKDTVLRKAWRRVISAYSRRFYTRRYDRLCLETIGGMKLLILPQVFNGVLMRSGRMLAESLDATLIRKDSRVLDLGTGSGLLAVRCAQLGASVVAVDINPEAVRCARINALLNQVDDRVEVRQGDLFDPVEGQRFDRILFNPPFYRGIPQTALDLAWRSEDTFERFLAGMDRHLCSDGYALVALSSDGDLAPALRDAEHAGRRVAPVRSRDLINEILTVYRVDACDTGFSGRTLTA